MTAEEKQSRRWMALFETAYLEHDPVKLLVRIAEAEEAMILRRKSLELTGVTTGSEYRALKYSLEDLRILRREESQRKL